MLHRKLHCYQKVKIKTTGQINLEHINVLGWLVCYRSYLLIIILERYLKKRLNKETVIVYNELKRIILRR